MPSCSEVWSSFYYKPLTGELVRISKTGAKLQSFGRRSTKGYVYGTFKGNSYYAHRLVWTWLHGEDPGAFEVDHIDRNRSNNTAWNLRKIPAYKQSLNTKCYKNNALGVRGVKAIAGASTYQARIRINGKAINLGCYPTVKEASKVYEYHRARRISSITSKDFN